MLVVPLLTRGQTNVGVLQLINAKNEKGKVIPFSGQDLLYITHYAQNAASAIEQAKLNREMVLRMVEISELRDPFETSQHAKRVGSYAVELYEKWALRRNIVSSEIKANREILRTAAMLHDVGKVAISDSILKKKGELTAAERAIMRMHTVYGARLFKHIDSSWDKMAMDVVLNHHECWDGSGYPGKIGNIFSKKIRLGPGKKGEQIPVFARIVMIADVYDSLISRRSYKEPWTQKEVVEYLEWKAGKQFDPLLVELFLNMQEIIRAIRQKYSY
jgi:putative nucleotidyltransferase with HDIG domain